MATKREQAQARQPLQERQSELFHNIVLQRSRVPNVEEAFEDGVREARKLAKHFREELRGKKKK